MLAQIQGLKQGLRMLTAPVVVTGSGWQLMTKPNGVNGLPTKFYLLSAASNTALNELYFRFWPGDAGGSPSNARAAMSMDYHMAFVLDLQGYDGVWVRKQGGGATWDCRLHALEDE